MFGKRETRALCFFVALCFLAAIAAGTAPFAAAANHTASTEAELRNALAAAANGDVILITAPITLPAGTNPSTDADYLHVGKNLTFRGSGGQHLLTGRWVIEGGATVTIENLALAYSSLSTGSSFYGPTRGVIDIEDDHCRLTLRGVTLTQQGLSDGILVGGTTNNGKTDITLSLDNSSVNTTRPGSQAITLKSSDSTVSLVNGSAINAPGAADFGITTQGDRATVNVTNSRIQTSVVAYPIKIGGTDSTVNVTNSSISGYYAISVISPNATVNVKNSTLTGTNTNDIYAYGIIALENGGFGVASNATVNVTNTDFIAGNNSAGTGKMSGIYGWAPGATVTVSESNFDLGIPYGNGAFGILLEEAGMTLNADNNYWGDISDLSQVIVGYSGGNSLYDTGTHTFYQNKTHTMRATVTNGILTGVVNLNPGAPQQSGTPQTATATTASLPSTGTAAAQTDSLKPLFPIPIGYDDVGVPRIRSIKGQATGKGQGTLQVEAELPGGRMLYQWQLEKDGVWEDVFGANGSLYRAKGLTAGQEYRFRCVVSSYAGRSAVSEPVALRGE